VELASIDLVPDLDYLGDDLFNRSTGQTLRVNHTNTYYKQTFVMSIDNLPKCHNLSRQTPNPPDPPRHPLHSPVPNTHPTRGVGYLTAQVLRQPQTHQTPHVTLFIVRQPTRTGSRRGVHLHGQVNVR